MLALVSLKMKRKKKKKEEGEEGEEEEESQIFVSVSDELATSSRAGWTQWGEGRLECKLINTFGNDRSQFIALSASGTSIPSPVLTMRWDLSGRMTLVRVKDWR